MFGIYHTRSGRLCSVDKHIRNGRVPIQGTGKAWASYSLENIRYGSLRWAQISRSFLGCLPMYEMVISSPSLMGSSALRIASLPVKLTAAFGTQE